MFTSVRLSKVHTNTQLGQARLFRSGGWVRKAENKAIAQHSWGLGFAELGKNQMNMRMRKVLTIMPKKQTTKAIRMILRTEVTMVTLMMIQKKSIWKLDMIMIKGKKGHDDYKQTNEYFPVQILR